MRAFFVLAAATAAIALSPAAASANTVTLSNGPSSGSVSSFGVPDSQTYGEVFTAPITGKLTSFTLSLDGAVGSLYGGVGTWNGPATYATNFGSPTNLYQSASVASTGAGSFTFSPNVNVVAGQQYVAYLSVFGDPNANDATSMPTSNVLVPGLDYFVWNNSTAPQNNPSWNYFFNVGGSGALFSATFAAVPEPATWALMLGGVFGAGAMLRLSRRRERLAHA